MTIGFYTALLFRRKKKKSYYSHSKNDYIYAKYE